MSEIKMQSIVQDAPNLDKDSRVTVAKIIYRHDPNLLFFKIDGSRCILNNLPENVINEIYNFIENKLRS